MRALLAALAAASALACAGAPAPQTGPAQGERLYRSKCAGCHRAYPPQQLDAERWAEVLGRMAPRAKLSDGERAAILEYVQSHARDAPAPAAAPRP
jgi:mono/diheme cytochrome c family protein